MYMCTDQCTVPTKANARSSLYHTTTVLYTLVASVYYTEHRTGGLGMRLYSCISVYTVVTLWGNYTLAPNSNCAQATALTLHVAPQTLELYRTRQEMCIGSRNFALPNK